MKWKKTNGEKDFARQKQNWDGGAGEGNERGRH